MEPPESNGDDSTASDGGESFVRFFAELRRCTFEVTSDLLAEAPGFERQRAVENFICSLVNVVHGFPDSHLPPPEMSTVVQRLGVCLRRFGAGAFRNLAIRAVVRSINVHVVDMSHSMDQVEEEVDAYMSLF